MTNILMGIGIFLAIDLLSTITFILVARRNKALRKRMVDGFKLLVGDAIFLIIDRDTYEAKLNETQEELLDEDDSPKTAYIN